MIWCIDKSLVLLISHSCVLISGTSLIINRKYFENVMHPTFIFYFCDERLMFSKYSDFQQKKKFMMSSLFYGTFQNI